VSPADAAAALRRTVATAVLMLPAEVDPGELPGGIERAHLCNLVPELPAGTRFRPPRLARLMNKQARLTLVVGHDGLGFQDDDGDRHFMHWSEIEAAVVTDEGYGLFVVGANLCAFVVHEDIYGRRAVDLVRARIPEPRILQPATAAGSGTYPDAVPVG
jgi:hypothetical protein